MRPVRTLPPGTPVYAALSTMRDSRNHLALVGTDNELLGIVTLQDLLNQLLPPQPRPAIPDE